MNEFLNLLQTSLEKLKLLSKSEKSIVKTCTQALNQLKKIRTNRNDQTLSTMTIRSKLLQPFLLSLSQKTRSQNLQIQQFCIDVLVKIICVEGAKNKKLMSEILNIFNLLCKKLKDCFLEVKLIQSFLTIHNSKSRIIINNSQLSTIVSSMFLILDRNDPLSYNTCKAALKQLCSMVFDKIVEAIHKKNKHKTNTNKDLQSINLQTKKKKEKEKEKNKNLFLNVPKQYLPPKTINYNFGIGGYMLFQDLCLLSNGDVPIWISRKENIFQKGCLRREIYCLNLIESILESHSNLFLTNKDFLCLIKYQLYPFFIEWLSNINNQINSNHNQFNMNDNNRSKKSDVKNFQFIFQKNCCILRLLQLIVGNYFKKLPTEIEILILSLIKIVENPNSILTNNSIHNSRNNTNTHNSHNTNDNHNNWLLLLIIEVICIWIKIPELVFFFFINERKNNQLFTKLIAFISNYINSIEVIKYINEQNIKKIKIIKKRNNKTPIITKYYRLKTLKQFNQPPHFSIINTLSMISESLVIFIDSIYKILKQNLSIDQENIINIEILPNKNTKPNEEIRKHKKTTPNEGIDINNGMTNNNVTTKNNKTLGIIKQICEKSWFHILPTFSLLLDHSIEENIVQILLHSYQNFIIISCITNNTNARDAFITFLNKNSQNNLNSINNFSWGNSLVNVSDKQHFMKTRNKKNLQKIEYDENNHKSSFEKFQSKLNELNIISNKNKITNKKQKKILVSINKRNLLAFKILLNIAQQYPEYLGKSWILFLENFDYFDTKIKQYLNNVQSENENLKSIKEFEQDEITITIKILDEMLNSFFQTNFEKYSKSFFEDFSSSLVILSQKYLMNFQKNKKKIKNIKINIKQNFGLFQLKNFLINNINKIDLIWENIIQSHLIGICKTSNYDLSKIGIDTIFEITLQIFQKENFNQINNEETTRKEKEIENVKEKEKEKEIGNVKGKENEKKKENEKGKGNEKEKETEKGKENEKERENENEKKNENEKEKEKERKKKKENEKENENGNENENENQKEKKTDEEKKKQDQNEKVNEIFKVSKDNSTSEEKKIRNKNIYLLFIIELEKIDNNEKWYLILNHLFNLIQTCGQKLGTGWGIILKVLLNRIKKNVKKEFSLISTILKFICTDLLSFLPPSFFYDLLNILTEYCKQKSNINNTLSTIELIWKVADFLAINDFSDLISNERLNKKSEKKLKNNQKNKVYEKENRNRAVSDKKNNKKEKTARLNIWIFLYSKFLELIMDKRFRIRNGSLTTFFSILSSYGDKLTMGEWNEVFNSIIKPLTKLIKNKFLQSCLNENNNKKKLKRNNNNNNNNSNNINNNNNSNNNEDDQDEEKNLIIHYSRNTNKKKWMSTLNLMITEMCGIFDNLYQCISKTNIFLKFSNLLIKLINFACNNNNQEISLNGFENFKSLVISSYSEKHLNSDQLNIKQQIWGLIENLIFSLMDNKTQLDFTHKIVEDLMRAFKNIIKRIGIMSFSLEEIIKICKIAYQCYYTELFLIKNHISRITFSRTTLLIIEIFSSINSFKSATNDSILYFNILFALLIEYPDYKLFNQEFHTKILNSLNNQKLLNFKKKKILNYTNKFCFSRKTTLIDQVLTLMGSLLCKSFPRNHFFKIYPKFIYFLKSMINEFINDKDNLVDGKVCESNTKVKESKNDDNSRDNQKILITLIPIITKCFHLLDNKSFNNLSSKKISKIKNITLSIIKQITNPYFLQNIPISILDQLLSLLQNTLYRSMTNVDSNEKIIEKYIYILFLNSSLNIDQLILNQSKKFLFRKINEQFIFNCTEELFNLIKTKNRSHDTNISINQIQTNNVSQLAIQYSIKLSIKFVDNFFDYNDVFNNQLNHLLLIMDLLEDSQIESKIFKEMSKRKDFENIGLKTNLNIFQFYKGEKSHLISLFPWFCKLISSHEIKIKKRIQRIFLRLSKELNLI
ncbi:protein mon2 [Anaeramoeba flamelloides]|uniref:Protein mon2 n=1 Tax=Anaeramoeba flamelloides TaxID=1746091 RepID=A0AAV7ZRZ1_9EUKA|nr:protein mon2 [Anaeramoeba flamelloides]